jgi:Uma2 family endonuclease
VSDSDLLEQAFRDSDVLEEYPFRVEKTNDMRSADIGMTTGERGRRATETGILDGPPDLVVEVLSPSNSVTNLKQYRRLCFEHGTQIFLTVDPEDSTVEVHLQAERPDAILKPGDDLTLSLFGQQKTIPISAIFAGITSPEAR